MKTGLYIVINSEDIQKRIEELVLLDEKYPDDPNSLGTVSRINELKQVLSNSKSLTPIIEDAFGAGLDFSGIGNFRKGTKQYQSFVNKQDYITNLKLDI